MMLLPWGVVRTERRVDVGTVAQVIDGCEVDGIGRRRACLRAGLACVVIKSVPRISGESKSICPAFTRGCPEPIVSLGAPFRCVITDDSPGYAMIPTLRNLNALLASGEGGSSIPAHASSVPVNSSFRRIGGVFT